MHTFVWRTCLLPPASCLLPPASCLLPPASLGQTQGLEPRLGVEGAFSILCKVYGFCLFDCTYSCKYANIADNFLTLFMKFKKLIKHLEFTKHLIVDGFLSKALFMGCAVQCTVHSVQYTVYMLQRLIRLRAGNIETYIPCTRPNTM